VSKRFTTYRRRAGGLKDREIGLVTGQRQQRETLWALFDVSLDVGAVPPKHRFANALRRHPARLDPETRARGALGLPTPHPGRVDRRWAQARLSWTVLVTSFDLVALADSTVVSARAADETTPSPWGSPGLEPHARRHGRPRGQRKGLTARTVPYSRSCWKSSEISSGRPCSSAYAHR
jgi:hypothetical protein